MKHFEEYTRPLSSLLVATVCHVSDIVVGCGGGGSGRRPATKRKGDAYTVNAKYLHSTTNVPWRDRRL